jgi:hypothetical protein
MRTSPSSSEPQGQGGEPAREADDEHARRRLRALQDRVDKLEQLADTVRQSTVWDYSVYDDVPDERWLAIDRDHYDQIIQALAAVDSWRPWERPLERRLGDV